MQGATAFGSSAYGIADHGRMGSSCLNRDGALVSDEATGVFKTPLMKCTWHYTSSAKGTDDSMAHLFLQPLESVIWLCSEATGAVHWA
jgi:hypothetical protein